MVFGVEVKNRSRVGTEVLYRKGQLLISLPPRRREETTMTDRAVAITQYRALYYRSWSYRHSNTMGKMEVGSQKAIYILWYSRATLKKDGQIIYGRPDIATIIPKENQSLRDRTIKKANKYTYSEVYHEYDQEPLTHTQVLGANPFPSRFIIRTVPRVVFALRQ